VTCARVFVTDSELAKPKARERVHAFDTMTGRHLWSYAYDVNYPDGAFDEKSLRGPIATPIINNGQIYTLGASGKVFCLEAVKGDVLWQKDLKQEYPGSDLYPSPSPLIEGDLLILFVGAKPGASVVAVNKNTGKEVWKALDEEASASSPIVVSAAGKRQLIVWTPQSVTVPLGDFCIETSSRGLHEFLFGFDPSRYSFSYARSA
jgi:outer membrane protein assembly factor BamB